MSALHEVQVNFTMFSSRNNGFIMLLFGFKKVLYLTGFLNHMKQVILVRKDLKLTKGKLAVQVAHASLCSALKVKQINPKLFDEWLNFGQKKVVLKVEDEAELHEFQKKSASMRIPNELIRDAGLTQLPPGTTTVLGIGPDEDEKIDAIVGKLSLL
jgi:PTH2 family peptidyl-tRNA hydrolase